MASVRIKVNTQNVETALQKTLKTIVTDEQTLKGVNTIIADAAEKYIPLGKTGNLSNPKYRTIGPKTITWGTGLGYAKYQYYGEVYGPNRPRFEKGNTSRIVGWYSPELKYPTGRTLGTPRFLYNRKGQVVWKFGYSTPGTRHHWVAEMWDHDSRIVNIKITKYLQRRKKELGL